MIDVTKRNEGRGREESFTYLEVRKERGMVIVLTWRGSESASSQPCVSPPTSRELQRPRRDITINSHTCLVSILSINTLPSRIPSTASTRQQRINPLVPRPAVTVVMSTDRGSERASGRPERYDWLLGMSIMVVVLALGQSWSPNPDTPIFKTDKPHGSVVHPSELRSSEFSN